MVSLEMPLVEFLAAVDEEQSETVQFHFHMHFLWRMHPCSPGAGVSDRRSDSPGSQRCKADQSAGRFQLELPGQRLSEERRCVSPFILRRGQKSYSTAWPKEFSTGVAQSFVVRRRGRTTKQADKVGREA